MSAPGPPPLPSRKSLGRAFTLNFFLPGAGQWYLGQRALGAMLAVPFMICLVAGLAIFLTGYVKYFTVVLSGELMREGQLEKLQDAFHPRWLVGLVLAGFVIFAIAMIALVRQHHRS